jgi:hypothetical protein
MVFPIIFYGILAYGKAKYNTNATWRNRNCRIK